VSKKSSLYTIISIFFIAAMILSGCAQATPTTAPQETTAPEVTQPPAAKLSVGVVLPTKDEPRWIQDETRFNDAFTAAGYDVQILFSQGDSAKEKANVESLISSGVQVIIICPQDATAAAAAADEAHAAGIKVISYDRLIRDTASVDYYVTFDSIQVGKLQGQYLVDHATGTGNPLYLYAGAATDNNAFLFFQGAWEVLQPKVVDGTFVIKNSSQAVALQDKATLTRDEMSNIIGQITTDWKFDVAKNLAEANLTAATAADKGDVFILAPNDGTARSIADVFAADKDVTSYVITGQDAEEPSIQYIIDGKQTMTVLKDVRTLVSDAIAAAIAYLQGSTPPETTTYNNGVVDVPAKPSAVIAVDQSNVVAAVIDSGYWPAGDFTGLVGGAVPTQPPPAAPVTVEWWHISTQDPGLSLWQTMADEYMVAHPNVTINITVLENEAFKTKLTTVMQGGTPPDIFQSWGGGVMNDQANAGLLLDISSYLDADGGAWRNSFGQGALAVYALEGENYGVPWDMGMVGWWYNKDIFTQAGITQVPTTWDEFLADVSTLKAAGVTPISLGEKDTWTGMHIWSYLATRLCGQEGFLAAANRTGAFTDDCFVEAGQKLQELIALDPFQPGFLGANHDEMQGYFGNGKAAMELSGQWAPSVESAQAADGVGVVNLGFFSFPSIAGGAGKATDAMGGGNGFALGKDASPEAVDFVMYLTAPEQQARMAAAGMGIPVVKGGETGLTDPNMLLVQQTLAKAEYFQLYYDQYMPSAMGSIINEAVAGLYAGTSTPDQVAQAIETGAQQVFGK